MSKNAVAKREEKSADPIRQAVDAMAPEFKAALPAHVSVDKFVRVSMTAINSDPNLRNADKRSLFGAVTKLAQDGLMPDGREAALVIFNSKQNGEWVKKVQAMPMVSGLMKMMRQSGEVAWIDAQIVRENDHFQYRPGIDETPIFEPDWFGDRGDVIGAYAVAKLKSGETVPPEIMNREQIEQVRNVSKAKDRGPWVDWFDQMALKTVLRRYLKRLPTSTDVLTAFDRDETMTTTIDHQPIKVESEPEPGNVTRLDALEHRIDEVEEQEGGASEGENTDAPSSDDLLADLAGAIEHATTAEELDAAQERVNAAEGEVAEEDLADLDKAIAAKRRKIK